MKISQDQDKRKKVNKNPAASSITTSEGSDRSRNFALLSDAQMAMAIKMTRKTTFAGTFVWLSHRTNGKAPRVPKVPGAIGNRPNPNQQERDRANLSLKGAL